MPKIPAFRPKIRCPQGTVQAKKKKIILERLSLFLVRREFVFAVINPNRILTKPSAKHETCGSSCIAEDTKQRSVFKT